ncbi:MAG TPA: hypothetical protein VFB14_25065 [Bryobacteraceae bacterium]|jgi:hypothetical protein|nr:hypothetical protein [Bryobacteraceae bacterium]
MKNTQTLLKNDQRLAPGHKNQSGTQPEKHDLKAALDKTIVGVTWNPSLFDPMPFEIRDPELKAMLLVALASHRQNLVGNVDRKAAAQRCQKLLETLMEPYGFRIRDYAALAEAIDVDPRAVLRKIKAAMMPAHRNVDGSAF